MKLNAALKKKPKYQNPTTPDGRQRDSPLGRNCNCHLGSVSIAENGGALVCKSKAAAEGKPSHLHETGLKTFLK